MQVDRLTVEREGCRVKGKLSELYALAESRGEDFVEAVIRSADYVNRRDDAFQMDAEEFETLRQSWYQGVRGVGDLIGVVTRVTGIRASVKALFGDDCGCDERQEKANRSAPINRDQL